MEKVTSYNTIIGLLLSNKRQNLGLSQIDVSKKLGVTSAGWGKIEKGLSTISIDNFFSACSALDLSPSELIKDAEDSVLRLKADGWYISKKKVDNDGLLWGTTMSSALAKGSLLGAIPVVGGVIAGALAAYAYLDKNNN